jgi:acyl-coenzyme A synthetase/AMP-(fatty) acid ligase
LCISAGETLPAHLGERWRAVVGVDILDGLGSTEMLQTFLSNRPGDVRYGSTGKPVPGYEVKVVDESGRELPAGEIGELVVRGPSAGESYWNHRAKSRRTFVGEWTYTGDKYLRDAEGYYYYCGRTDDMFKVNGMWVSPFEVEAVLVSHEAVLEAAVIGQEDGDGADQAESLHRAQERLSRRRAALRCAADACEGARGRMEISALDRGPARLATDADGQNPALQAEGLMAALGCSMARR